MNIKILRRRFPGDTPYWQTFAYAGPEDASVASALDSLNYRDDVVDIEGKHAPRISWECSCLQGMCGGCAMVINGTPALACETFLRDLPGDTLTLEPLRKFPVIADLVVDRTGIQAALLAAEVYPTPPAPAPTAEYPRQYAVSKCLKCGLCLEACPNYGGEDGFLGALFANDCYLVDSRDRSGSAALRRTYRRRFADGCSKSLSCMAVCPMHLPTLASMAHMNRKKK